MSPFHCLLKPHREMLPPPKPTRRYVIPAPEGGSKERRNHSTWQMPTQPPTCAQGITAPSLCIITNDKNKMKYNFLSNKSESLLAGVVSLLQQTVIFITHIQIIKLKSVETFISVAVKKFLSTKFNFIVNMLL